MEILETENRTKRVRRRKEGKEGGQKDGLSMSLHVSGPALNYNERRKKSLVMASLEYIIIALVCGAGRWRVG